MTGNKSTNNKSNILKHIPALDGIRGLSISWVLLHHLSYSGGLKKSSVIIDKLYYIATYPGWMGVDLFFVLSGFLITGILYDTKENNNYFRNFYMRRFLRIFPLYYGFLAIFFLILPNIISFGDKFELLRDKQIWYWCYISNINIAINGWPEFGYIGHFWSLAIEEQFYLLWPLLVFFCRRRNLCLICAGCILIAFGIRVAIFLTNPFGTSALGGFVFTPARIDILAVGALIALLLRNSHSKNIMNRWAKPVFSGSSLTLTVIFIWKRGFCYTDPLVYTIGFTIISLLLGALLILVIKSSSGSLLNQFFSNEVLMFMGRYSYAIYVFHPPIIKYLESNGFSISLFPIIMGSKLPGQIIYTALVTLSSLILSLFSWAYWESWFLKLKHYFPYKAA